MYATALAGLILGHLLSRRAAPGLLRDRPAALGSRVACPQGLGLDLGDQVLLQDGAPAHVSLLQGPAGFLDQLAEQLLEVGGPRSQERLCGHQRRLLVTPPLTNRHAHISQSPFVVIVMSVLPDVTFSAN